MVLTNNTETPKRWAVVKASPSAVIHLRGLADAIRPLPEDARVVRAAYDPLEDLMVFVVESVEFLKVQPTWALETIRILQAR